MTRFDEATNLPDVSAPIRTDVSEPLVTVAVPSLNQRRFLDQALRSIVEQEMPVEIFVMDGGSTDGSLEVIRAWEPYLAGWRTGPDGGQANAINEGIAAGRAPYVTWLNSDDFHLPGGLEALVEALKANPGAPAAYGRAWNHVEATGRRRPCWVQPFSERALALRCIVCQPAALIRRSAWEQVGGLDGSLHLAMDYDLWWKLYREVGPLVHTPVFVAANRDHSDTKTNQNRNRHYEEAISVIKKYHHRVPLKWYLYQPYAVGFKSLIQKR